MQDNGSTSNSAAPMEGTNANVQDGQCLALTVAGALANGAHRLARAQQPAPPRIEIPLAELGRSAELGGEEPAFQRYYRSFLPHLEETGCAHGDVAAYVQAGARTLASLYLLISRPGNPSPNAIRALALRYALDPRRPVENILGIARKRALEGWWIDSTGMGLWRAPYARLICGSQFLRYLDAALPSPPQISRLMELIESDLGGIPVASDGWHENAVPTAHFGDGVASPDAAQPKQANGSEARQTDDSAFRPASEFLWGEYDSHAKIKRALDKNAWIRRRKPSQQRLEIHAGDWLKFLSDSQVGGGNFLDLPAELVDSAVKQIEERKTKERTKK